MRYHFSITPRTIQIIRKDQFIKMVRVCAVRSCFSRLGNGKKTEETPVTISFFRPMSELKLKRWSQSLGVPLKTTDYVCQFHFAEEDIRMNERIVIGDTAHLHYVRRKTLTEEALPTVEYQSALDSELQVEQPEPKQLQQQQLEHNYVEQRTSGIAHRIADLKKVSVLPQHWFYVESPPVIEFMRFNPANKEIRNHIVWNEDFSVTVICSNDQKVNLYDRIPSTADIYKYLKSVENWPLCVGTQIEKKRYSEKCKGVIIGDESYQRRQPNPRCKTCRTLRSQLLTHKGVRLNSLEK